MKHTLMLFVYMLPAIGLAGAACIAAWRDHTGTALCLALLCALLAGSIKVNSP